MWHFLLLILLVSGRRETRNLAHLNELFQIIQWNGTLYLTKEKHRSLHRIPDMLTAQLLGFSTNDIRNESKLAYKISPISVPKKHMTDVITSDDVIELAMWKISTFQHNLFHTLEYVAEMLNPSMTVLKESLLVCQGGSATNTISCRLLNHSMFPLSEEAKLCGISSTEFREFSPVLVGQDVRLLVTNPRSTCRFQTFYTNFPVVLMGTSAIGLSTSTETNGGTSKCSETPCLAQPISTKIIFLDSQESSTPQKNWSPFTYNGTVHYVQSINPLHIVKTTQSIFDKGGESSMYAESVSLSDTVRHFYDYGELRGGSNAVFLQAENKFISFFHSSCWLPGPSKTKTYFMGAYTFTAHPPFRILEISPFPLVTRDLYSGPWSLYPNRRNDYVIFPGGLILRNDLLVLSFGRNDHEGWLCSFKLRELLESLVPVD
jgi:hypothetical protein